MDMINRRRTRQIKVGGVKIGGGAPISVQSMTKVATSDVKAVIAEVRRLEAAGCEIIRVAVKDLKDAEAIRAIKRGIKIPLVADIHFDYRLALASIKAGADKVRINPGNMGWKNGMAEVIKAARKARTPIRIGLNSGSTKGDLAASAIRTIKLFEDSNFRDIIVSLKASDVLSTVEAYRKISGLVDYPLHLGVTAAGPYDSGIVKSSIGIGALLLDGIGDTIRVSLTADPVEEVIAARNILDALAIRRHGYNIISCPACGRCQVDLGRIAREFEHAIRNTQYTIQDRGLTVAIMGCEVNGPGEAAAADIGIAAGKGSGALFIKGRIVRRVKEKDFVKELIKELKKI
jgi:(E)-4-hydroxy-3-methylbut-2-enyl-diphosphate synthase